MLTVELNDQIKQLYRNYPLDERDEDFFLSANFDELNAGDIVFFPFNVRVGLYKVIDMEHLGIKTKGLYRNACAVPLFSIPENKGVVLVKADPTHVDWDEWEDMEGLVYSDLVTQQLNWQEVHGFSDWYEWGNWTSLFPPEFLHHIRHSLPF